MAKLFGKNNGQINTKENNLEIILQPKMDGDDLKISHQGITNIYNKFVKEYKKTRLIPQVHKFLNVR